MRNNRAIHNITTKCSSVYKHSPSTKTKKKEIDGTSNDGRTPSTKQLDVPVHSTPCNLECCLLGLLFSQICSKRGKKRA